MITWHAFPLFSAITVFCGLTGSACCFGRKGRSLWGIVLFASGILCLTVFIAGLWLSLQRPPLRTMGETRLWYSLFMMLSGLGVYLRTRYPWLLLLSHVLATVFIIINAANPDIHDRTLMPVLQSAWFIPHVIVYIFAYSLFGCASLLAIAALIKQSSVYFVHTDRLVRLGFCFLTFGMLSGCIWAKDAWGAYWSWDLKEIWAAATWCMALVYIHSRLTHPIPAFSDSCSLSDKTLSHSLTCREKWQYTCIILCFLLLQMCWYGVNLLPWASTSMHSYT